ncbi:Dph6-related ATP pyrophosphatase [Flammeovirga agarivorans]|uniref:Diphthine--ammonia ligase n=1 Tax=Flammeovirga agarivorans TaxID=2726742 RepID=A0A7X8XU21_9BACT|nr:diphthine--ammonia ligase [Flammeovirga agarivorans]NLR89957.1 diphthine--ammonia ligase [Flammeovirga agarivorans]
MKRALFQWSGGKDSSFALFKAMKEWNIEGLFTSLSAEFKRISMHGVREELLDLQAESIGLPLHKMFLEEDATHDTYDRELAVHLKPFINDGIKDLILGDIYLEDLRKYREDQMGAIGLTCNFPLWGGDTHQLFKDFVDAGFKAVTVAVNDELGEKFIGRTLDMDFYNELPDGVDPCGEKGEFHTFVYDGPIFSKPIPFKIGDKLVREYNYKDADGNHIHSKFHFCDLEMK